MKRRDKQETTNPNPNPNPSSSPSPKDEDEDDEGDAAAVPEAVEDETAFMDLGLDERRALRDGYEDVAPTYIKFAVGKVMVGSFVRFGETLMTRRDPVTDERIVDKLETVVMDTARGLYEFNATVELHRKLQASEEGRPVYIERLLDDETGQNARARFDVRFKRPRGLAKGRK